MNAGCPDLLAALQLRMRDLELDACAIKARVEEVRELITMIERPPRRARPRKPEVVHDATAPALFTHTDTDEDNGGSAA